MKTLTEKIADLIAADLNKPEGFVYSQIEQLMKEKLSEFNASSASPVLSHLRLVGVLSAKNEAGQLRNFFVRPLTQKDLRKIRDHSNKVRHSREEPKAPAGAAMIAIMLGENRTEIVGIVQAKRIYLSLKPLFESNG